MTCVFSPEACFPIKGRFKAVADSQLLGGEKHICGKHSCRQTKLWLPQTVQRMFEPKRGALAMDPLKVSVKVGPTAGFWLGLSGPRRVKDPVKDPCGVCRSWELRQTRPVTGGHRVAGRPGKPVVITSDKMRASRSSLTTNGKPRQDRKSLGQRPCTQPTYFPSTGRTQFLRYP